MSPGNASDIGDLQNQTRYSSSTNDDTYAINAGGLSPTGAPSTDTFITYMDYITMANTGNASTFGNLYQNMQGGTRGTVGNNTIGVFGGGYKDQTYTHQSILQSVTIATTGNATSFGNLLSLSLIHISEPTRPS